MLLLLLARDRGEMATPRNGCVLMSVPVHLLIGEVVLDGLSGQKRCKHDLIAHLEALLLDQLERHARSRRLSHRDEHVSRDDRRLLLGFRELHTSFECGCAGSPPPTLR